MTVKPARRELETKIKELEKRFRAGIKDTRRLEELDKLYSRAKEEIIHCNRIIHEIRATAGMPELYLDRAWNIVGYSGNFLRLTQRVVGFSQNNC